MTYASCDPPKSTLGWKGVLVIIIVASVLFAAGMWLIFGAFGTNPLSVVITKHS